MKAGELRTGIAKSLEVDQTSIRFLMRVLVEDGLLTTGARGVNAPDMIPLDASRILIALLATDKTSHATDAVRDFGAMVADDEDCELTFDGKLADVLIQCAATDADCLVSIVPSRAAASIRSDDLGIDLHFSTAPPDYFFEEDAPKTKAEWSKRARQIQADPFPRLLMKWKHTSITITREINQDVLKPIGLMFLREDNQT